MDCNKDEALRAKAIAERRLTEKDFMGAKKFASKAQTLYPGLDGLSQMLTTLDVYISAENKIGGEMDWYGILGVTPAADDETVKKQYRKLALTLHPDKNKSVGADGAFKLISEAWSLLSDKAKRLAYNQRTKGLHQRVPPKNGGQSVSQNANGFHNFTGSASTNLRTQKNSANSAQARTTSVPPPSHPRTDTFWTICHQCKMHYEYLRVYLNHTLLCPNCHQAFLASETAPPINFTKPSNPSSRQRFQKPGYHAANGPSDSAKHAGGAQNSGPGDSTGPNSFNHSKFPQGASARTAGVGNSFSSPSIAARAANVIQQANEKLRREREEAQATSGYERLLKKSRGLDDYGGNGYGGHLSHQMGMGNGGTGVGSLFGLKRGGLDTDRAHGFSSIYRKYNSTRELTPLELRNMLIQKARVDVHKKLTEWNSETVTKESKKEKGKGSIKGEGREPNGNTVSSGTRGGHQAKKCSNGSSAVNADEEGTAPMAINVPDPDFHDFDGDRTEKSFKENQVWAAYDDDGGMPRFYAMIHKVISLKPFKMEISWLNSKTSNEFGGMDWAGSGFTKTCGVLRVGRHEYTKSLNSFSHEVKWSKGPRGTVCIFPKKGDVWALYRNWSPNWDENTPDEVVHEYDMVEVLEDYNEDVGISVVPLVKVAGFRTIFQRHKDPNKVRRIPKEEMFQFSHQVPNYLLTGNEAQNAPKNCQELDPAATPLELLQVITEVDDVTIKENDHKSGKETSQVDPVCRVDEIVTNTAEAKEGKALENSDITRKEDSFTK